MNRRRYLHGLGVVGLASIAGCVGGEEGPPATEPTPTEASPTEPAPDTTTTEGPTTTAGSPATTTAGGGPVEVAAGPEGRLRFEPETVEISVGDTVRWTFESPGHNVTSKPGSSEKVRNPPDAEPFASYEGDQHYAVDPVGTTYEHTFDVPGEYVYVCAPHADQGMVGTIVVTE